MLRETKVLRVIQNKGFSRIDHTHEGSWLNNLCKAVAVASMSAVGLMSVEQQVKEERWVWGRKEQRQTKPTRTDWNPHQPLPTSPSNFSNINDSQKLLLQGDAYAPGRGGSQIPEADVRQERKWAEALLLHPTQGHLPLPLSLLS